MIEKKSMLNRVRSEFSFIKGNFLLLLIGWLLIDFTREMAFTYYPLYVEALGGTPTIIGLMASVAAIFEALFQFPGGYIADKYGRKKIIMVMTLTAAVGYLFYALAPNWQTVWIGSIICSISFMYSPAFNAIVMDSLPEDKRGTGFSLINLITRVSTTPSPLIAGFLYTSFGLVRTSRIAFLGVFLAFMIAATLRSRLEETLPDAEKVETKELLHTFTQVKTYWEGISVWRKVPKSALAFLIIQIIFVIPNVMFNSTLQFYFIRDLGITPVQFSYMGTVIGVSMILLAIPTGKVIDRIGRVKPMIIGWLLMIVLLPLVPGMSFNMILLSTPAIGLVNLIFYSAGEALFADLVPPEHRGKIQGSKGFFMLLAVALGNILGGYVYDNISHSLPLWSFWAVSIPCIFLTWLFVKEPEREAAD